MYGCPNSPVKTSSRLSSDEVVAHAGSSSAGASKVAENLQAGINLKVVDKFRRLSSRSTIVSEKNRRDDIDLMPRKASVTMALKIVLLAPDTKGTFNQSFCKLCKLVNGMGNGSATDIEQGGINKNKRKKEMMLHAL